MMDDEWWWDELRKWERQLHDSQTGGVVMTIYVATGFDNKAAFHQAREAIEARGWRVAYDWTVHTDDDDMGRVAGAEMAAIVQADALLAIMPGSGGTHFEIGLAVGQGKPTVCVDPLGEMANPFREAVARVLSVGDALEVLDKWCSIRCEAMPLVSWHKPEGLPGGS